MKKAFKVNDARILCEVSRVLSVSIAAKNLGMAQPNVSKVVAGLEKDIGLEIFSRKGNGLIMTPFGTGLINHLQEFIQKWNEVNDYLSHYKYSDYGNVSVYASTGIITSLINNFVPAIDNSKNISISFKTIGLNNEGFTDGVGFPDDCDILLSFFLPQNISLVAYPVFPLHFNVFASPEYLSNKKINSPDELGEHNCIILRNNSGGDEFAWLLNNGIKQLESFRVTGKYMCDNFSTACALARTGNGLVYAPWEGLIDDIKKGTLVPCFDFNRSNKVSMMLIFKKRKSMPYYIEQVLNELKEYCAVIKLRNKALMGDLYK